MRNNKYGYIPQLPDQRDLQYKVDAPIQNLPPVVDLRAGCPPVYDQASLGSCVGNGVAAAIEFEQMKEKDPSYFMPSRLFVYYGARLIENTVKSDSGAQIRDGIKVVVNSGVCKESTWPYDITKFAKKPPTVAYKEALKYKALVYSAVAQDENSVKQCLANGDVIVFGFTVYSSFESQEVAKTGIMPMPAPNEKVLGGHCVVAVSYNDNTQMIGVRNSWGSEWGNLGYFEMPYKFFFSNQTSDFWSIKKVMI